MHLAFIGGTRFIGPAAVRAALRRGHPVSVLHRGVHENPTPEARSVKVDRTDGDALRKALETVRADVAVDTRAMTRRDAETTVRVVTPLDTPLVVLSSQDVYGQFGALLGHPAPEPEARITESSPLTVPYPYRHIEGAHADPEYDKKDVERVVEDAVARDGLRSATVLRMPPTYGHGDPARRFGGIVDALDDGDGRLPHEGGARWRWTHGHVDDVGLGIVLAAEAGLPGHTVLNLGEPDAPTMGQWAERLAEHVGETVRWVPADGDLPEPLEHLGVMANDVVVDTSRARAMIGYAERTTPAERVADIVAWARASR